MAGGFVPVRHITGDNSFATRRFKKTGAATDQALIYVGDPVYILTNGDVRRLTAAEVTAGAGIVGAGVVARVLRDEKGTPRVHGLPDQHPNISLSADTEYLDVYIDPGIVYQANIGASAGASMIGQNATLSAGTRVTAAGLSGSELSLATSAASNEAPFRIVGMSQFSLDTQQGNAAGNVECMFNTHWLKSTANIL